MTHRVRSPRRAARVALAATAALTALAAGCSSGGGGLDPVVMAPPIVPPAPPPAPDPDPLPEDPIGTPTGGSGPSGTGGGGIRAYTGTMDGVELLARSALAYGRLSEYADSGVLFVDQPAGRTEYRFVTTASGDETFAFDLVSSDSTRLPSLRVTRAARRYEVVRGSSYGQARTIEDALRPLDAEATEFATVVPKMLIGIDWAGPADDYTDARIIGTATVSGQPVIGVDLRLAGLGEATVWIDEATLLIRQISHQSVRSETRATVNFQQVRAR
ncbi:MAG: hypothetical protein AAFX79_09120 [Planctomycetota bacterium]